MGVKVHQTREERERISLLHFSEAEKAVTYP